ncbi:MAG TPA: hypothetical protein VIV34_02605, partial [Pseudolabrys sp.]
RSANRRGGARRTKPPARPSHDVEDRHWPVVPIPPRNDIAVLEEKIAGQAAELNLRCTQVADLYNLQQQQANELQTACEEIDRLSGTISQLLGTTEQHEGEVAAARQKLFRLENEKAALRAQLDRAFVESNAMSQRLLAVETAFNDRETSIASALEKIEALNAELVSASAERFKLVAAAEGDKQRYRSALYQQKLSYEDRIKKLESGAARQDGQIKGLEEVRDRLARRVDILEALRRSEREAADMKIKQLTAELQRERQGHSADEQASAAMRQEINVLLPKLAARRDQAIVGEPEIPMSRDNAA